MTYDPRPPGATIVWLNRQHAHSHEVCPMTRLATFPFGFLVIAWIAGCASSSDHPPTSPSNDPVTTHAAIRDSPAPRPTAAVPRPDPASSGNPKPLRPHAPPDQPKAPSLDE